MPVKTHWPITYRTCGHTETKDLSHKPAHKRAEFARWLSNKTCTDCWRAEQGLPRRADWVEDKDTWIAQQREKEAAAERDWAATAGMPALTASSDKQLDYATKTRYQLLHQLYVWCVEEGNDPDAYTEYEDIARTLDRARWWLDQRDQADEDPETLIELLHAAAADGDGTDCENTY